mgnify:CR=1 FL=1
MSGYKHGAYGSLDASVITASDTAPSVPLFVGRAPVNLVRGYATAGIINTPVYIGDLGAKNTIGYSDNWEDFELCEALSALFNNSIGNIGPAYFINVLNPDVHKKSEKTTKDLTFTHGRAYITSDTIIIDTFALADKTEGVDYNLSYNYSTGRLAISSVDSSNPITGTLSASYYEVDPSAVTDDDIIGNVTADGVYTGLQSGLLMYPDHDAIINLIAAPGWSEHPAVYDALVDFCQAINKHWYAMPYADIPIEPTVKSEVTLSGRVGTISDAKALTDSLKVYDGETALALTTDYTVEKSSTGFTVTLAEGSTHASASKITVEYKTVVDTLALAKQWKADNGYDSMYTKVFWPQSKTSDGKIYHLSSLAIAETLRVDGSHDGVPMETCSNETIPVAAQYFGEHSKNQGFDQASGNTLNEVGITTLVKWGGAWKLWGDHTAAFHSADNGHAAADVDPLEIFDVNVRMQEYIINSFEEDHGEDVDGPMTPNMRDTILEFEQQKLDALVAQGALIGNPTITFTESENSVADMRNGDFTWNIIDTPTPPAKSLTAKVAYTDAGFSSFFGKEEE